MDRRCWFLWAVTVGAAFVFCTGAMAQERPNIVLILADDLGYGDLSSYGGEDIRTPYIDRIVSEGMRFDRFYANCPVCSPTRAALLTGRYPDLVGVPGVIRTHRENSWGRLADGAVLLPDPLNAAGYHTALIGKWHLGLEAPNRPTDRGFDYFHGWLGDMMDDYYEHRRHDINYMRRNEDVIDPEGHATDLFTDWAVDYIEARAGGDEPFFLFLAYNAPHTPIQPPADWVDKVIAREEGIDEDRAKLVALIEHMDAGIGEVLATLEDTGMLNETLVIFTSDNGGQLNVGGNNGATRGGKQDMYEGGIRVPMGAMWPGQIDAGTRSERIALTMDLFPTVCDAAGAEFDEVIEGESFLDTLMGERSDGPDRTLFWVRREGGRYGGKAYHAARMGPWKLVQNSPFEAYELYNLEEDPLETSPIVDRRPKFRELFEALRGHVNDSGLTPWQREE